MDSEAALSFSVVIFSIVGPCICGILGIIFKGFLAGFGIALLSLPLFFIIGVVFGLVVAALFCE